MKNSVDISRLREMLPVMSGTRASFGQRLRSILKAKSISQRMLANATGMLESRISQFANDLRSPGYEQVVLICDAIGATENQRKMLFKDAALSHLEPKFRKAIA